MKKICLVSSLNPSDDIRIFRKEALSLSKKFQVDYICPNDGKESYKNSNVNHIYIKYPSNVLKRLKNLKEILSLIRKNDYDIVHVQNPELLLITPFIKSKVIFDMHEDFEEGIKDKKWIPNAFRNIISIVYSVLLKTLMKKKLSATIVTTPLIQRKFSHYKNVYIIENFAPIILQEDLEVYKIPEHIEEVILKYNNCNKIIFTGLINQQRGILESIESIKYVDNTVLFLLGICSDEFKEKMKQVAKFHNVSERVIVFDSIKFEEMLLVMRKMDMGILPYLPLGNHKVTRPNKLFEYMLCELPIIASDFPLYKEVVQQGIGVTVNPNNARAISDAIVFLSDKNKKAEMGFLGKELYKSKYNWAIEEKKLFEIYQKLLGEKK